MKNLIILIICILLFSCEKEGELTKNSNSNLTVSQNSILKYKAVFVPTSGITASGEANIFLGNSQYKLVLKNFSVTSGPDLKIYLSKTDSTTEFVSLGNINSQTIFNIPQSVDIATYSYILIHCQQYNHLFATAKLIQN
jgi:hypothetical protein